MQFIFNDNCFEDENMIDLFQNCIIHFAKHLNRIALARILVRISKQFKNLGIAMNFLQTLIISQFDGKSSKKVQNPSWNEIKNASQNQTSLMNKIAILIIKCEIAHIHLIGKNVNKCQILLSEITKEMEDHMGNELHAQYYRISLQYYKVIGNAQLFLHFSLLFLAYMKEDSNQKSSSLSTYEKTILASDICLAALLSDCCYNFSEIIDHPLIETLFGNPEYDWLYQMISIFNLGSLQKWNSFISRHKSLFMKHKTISNSIAFLEQKIRLMALIEFVFKGKEDSESVNGGEYQMKRILTFEAICEYCDIAMDECEYILIRAFSLGIIKGIIDECAKTVQILYIVPRSLNVTQVAQLEKKMGMWLNKIQSFQENIHMDTNVVSQLI